MMKIEHADVLIVATAYAFATFVLNCFLFQNTSSLRNCFDKIFSTICVCSFITHYLYGIAPRGNRQSCPWSDSVNLSDLRFFDFRETQNIQCSREDFDFSSILIVINLQLLDLATDIPLRVDMHHRAAIGRFGIEHDE